MGQRADYSEIKDDIRTGDVALFHGDSFAAFLVELGGDSIFSHAGMFIREGEELYFWDAPGGGPTFPDPYYEDHHEGCRVAPAEMLLKEYASRMPDHQFWFRQVNPPVGEKLFGALRIFIDQVNASPFPDRMALARDYIRGRVFCEYVSLDSFFCSELVAASYSRMGLIRYVPPPSKYGPADFSEERSDKELPLSDGVSLGPQIHVNWDGPLVPGITTLPMPENPYREILRQL